MFCEQYYAQVPGNTVLHVYVLPQRDRDQPQRGHQHENGDEHFYIDDQQCRHGYERTHSHSQHASGSSSTSTSRTISESYFDNSKGVKLGQPQTRWHYRTYCAK